MDPLRIYREVAPSPGLSLLGRESLRPAKTSGNVGVARMQGGSGHPSSRPSGSGRAERSEARPFLGGCEAAMRSLVECYWWSEVRAPAAHTHRHRVLPDGCIDVLFDLTEGARGYVVGAMTRALIVVGAGPQRMVAARFHPGGASAFFRQPMHEWTDCRLDLSQAWPEVSALAARMAAAGFPQGALQVLDSELQRRLAASPPVDFAWQAGLLWLRQQPALSVREAASRLGLSRQHLTRRCKAATGIGPKQLQRIARLRRALAAARQEALPWAQVALRAGYCDQAHLVRECRALTGLTPSRLV